MTPKTAYDIILVTPLEPGGAQDYFHIGLLTLATYLTRKGHNVCFFDRNAMVYGENLSIEAVDARLVETITASRPKIVGFTFYTSYFSDIMRCSRMIKDQSPGTCCIAGGVHPTFEPQRTLEQIPYLDLVVIGPGEKPVDALLNGEQPEKIPGVACFSAGRYVAPPLSCTVRRHPNP